MGYQIPRYRAPDDVTWHHVLHGNIPNHQIDFMYAPEVPQGVLTPTHFSHMTRLMKYIEPQTHASHAFAIGNLSRDDTQHEPGHGALGIIFGMRIGGATDHAGRQNPPFAHGILTVDRELVYATLLEASATFYRHVMYAGEAQSTTSDFYKSYVRTMVEAPEEVNQVLARYVSDFNDLPRLRKSPLNFDWEADEEAPTRRVMIVHPHGESFGTIAHAAAKIASFLYRSNIKWTAISTGREADIPGGVSVRFVSERDVSADERRNQQLHVLEELPEDEGEIGKQLFGAHGRGEEKGNRKYVGWREKFASQAVPEEAPPGPSAAGAFRRAQMGSLPDGEGRHEGRPEGRHEGRESREGRGESREGRGEPRPSSKYAEKYTEAGTEILARAPVAELMERGAGGGGKDFSVTGSGNARKAAGEGPKGRPVNGHALGGASGGNGKAEAGAAVKAVATAGGAQAPEWRDVGGAKKGAAAGSAAGLGGGEDDIEITVEPPAGSSKKWVWAVIGLVAVGAGAAVALGVPGKLGIEGLEFGLGAATGGETPTPGGQATQPVGTGVAPTPTDAPTVTAPEPSNAPKEAGAGAGTTPEEASSVTQPAKTPPAATASAGAKAGKTPKKGNSVASASSTSKQTTAGATDAKQPTSIFDQGLDQSLSKPDQKPKK
ncbi:hypothetical protein [Chondromyces apiculatus]|uniref:EBNA-1 protein n=1 Tax=Chondromyces apiculatus DSM 436 TaxID=1192034 RepID=A0A017SU84_9BACT|nr:hypothetical protein [Chondromyces apiculatus]EYF00160.1 EBNA-1 protein [Chondromyces apiculatus DSM 436]